MMIVQYGNFFYFLPIIIIVAIIIGLYFLLRNKTDKTKQIVCFILIMINLIQHLFKHIFWPHLWGTSFGMANTACNLCALLIIVSPLIFLSKNSLLKDFVVYFGCNGGIITIFIPYWFIGETLLSSEAFRFYFCHGMLLITSILPPLLKIHKLNFYNFWKIGFVFAFSLMLVIFNNMLYYIAIGQTENLFATLYQNNPSWSFHADGNFSIVYNIVEVFSPKIFFNPETNLKVPILWYFVPIYLLTTFLVIVFCIFFDKEGTKDFITKIKNLFNIIKGKIKSRN